MLVVLSSSLRAFLPKTLLEMQILSPPLELTELEMLGLGGGSQQSVF